MLYGLRVTQLLLTAPLSEIATGSALKGMIGQVIELVVINFTYMTACI